MERLEAGPIRVPRRVRIAAYPREFEFDDNQLDRLSHLLLLKGACLAYQSELAVRQDCVDIPVGTGVTSFFLDMSNEVEALIYTFINDEATTCLANRGPTTAIIEQLRNDAEAKEVNPLLFFALKDYQRLDVTYRDHYIGRCYLDFTVTTYSIFESWMSKLYAFLKQTEKERRSKRREKIKRLIAELQNATDDTARDEIIDMIGKAGGGQTSAGEIGFIFSRIKTYPRPDKEADEQFAYKYGAMRNTVHNLGINRQKRDFEMAGSDFNIAMPAGKPAWTADRSDRARTCLELVDIYAAVVNALNVAGQPCCMTIEPPPQT